ncbi:hypothetical protein B0H67DRAFT_570262 [Lasiosphaeris hirsuta]|uniref:Uncharacterized protein n=1 Tax=Lasiosphaeris hirsuta TaxID=260670 RepID=A0AA40E352_9PEZI|nr:hypothetical protein B0H67DRAFT_570262 [Lasiosphaeris hirsuta]
MTPRLEQTPLYNPVTKAHNDASDASPTPTKNPSFSVTSPLIQARIDTHSYDMTPSIIKNDQQPLVHLRKLCSPSSPPGALATSSEEKKGSRPAKQPWLSKLTTATPRPRCAGIPRATPHSQPPASGPDRSRWFGSRIRQCSM